MPRNCRTPITEMIVVVPAHDEVDALPGALASIAIAAGNVTADVTLVVVLDACTDGTGVVVPPGVATRIINARNVGCARAAGFADRVGGEHIWFATTDADSHVPPDWLVGHARLADSGADAVAGTIVPDGWAGWPASTARTFTAHYDNRDGHRHVHGANLGIRSSLYRAIGGFAPLDEHEDVDLIRRVTAHGARVAWSAHAPVRTSTRRVGRTPGGFAARLAEFDEPVAG